MPEVNTLKKTILSVKSIYAMLCIVQSQIISISCVKFVFPQSMTFQTIMLVYPVSLGATALLILIATLILRPSRRYAHLESPQGDK